MKKNQIFLGILILALISLMVSFIFSKLIFVFLTIMIIPGLVISYFLPKPNFNIYDQIFFSPALGTIFGVILGIFLNYLHLPINYLMITLFYSLFYLILIIWLIFKFRKIFQNRTKIDIIDNIRRFWPYYVGFLIFLTAVWAKLSPTFQVLAPLGMDPVAHGMWTKQIIDFQKITYFYSPGFHIIAAFSYLLTKISIAQQILYLTNFFNAYLVLSFLVLILKFFKNRNLAVISAFLVAFSLYPSLFYQSDGKNALVMSLSILPIAMLICYQTFANSKPNNLRKYLILNNLIFYGLGIIHYPTAFIFLLFLIACWLNQLIRRHAKEKLIISFKKLFWGAVPGLILLILWAIFHLKGSADSLVQNAQNISIIEAIKSYSVNIKAIFSQYQISTEYFYFIIFLIIFSWLAALKSRARIFIFWNLLVLICWGVIAGLNLKSANILVRTSIAIYYFLIIFSGLYVLKLALKQIKWHYFSAILSLILILFSLGAGLRIHQQYLNYQKQNSLIFKPDLEAFKWLDQNLPANSLILNNAIKGDRSIIFGLDSGVWLPVYTDHQIALPFYDMANPILQENYQLLASLKQNSQNQRIISQLKHKKIDYFFIGSKSIGDQKLSPKLFENQKYQKIYQSNGVSIFKIR